MSKRCLSDRFLTACKDGGMLSSLVARVKQDNTLAFEIRDLHVSLYYRGGKLAEIKEIAVEQSIRLSSALFKDGEKANKSHYGRTRGN